jgi:hypothetical protein
MSFAYLAYFAVEKFCGFCAPGSTEDAGGEEGFDGGGEGGGKFVEDGRGGSVGKSEGARGGLQEAARGLLGVTDEALSQRQRIDRQRDAIDEGVPAVGFAAFDGGEVALDDAFVAEGAESLQLAQSRATAGGGKFLEDGLVRQFVVPRDEFADFVLPGVGEGALDGGEFEGLEDAGVVIFEEGLQVRSGGDLARGKGAGAAGECFQPGRGAELLHQWTEVTE